MSNLSYSKEVLTNFTVPIRANPGFHTSTEWVFQTGGNGDIPHPLPGVRWVIGYSMSQLIDRIPEKFKKIVNTTPLHISITGSTVKHGNSWHFPGSRKPFLIMGGFMGEAFMSSF